MFNRKRKAAASSIAWHAQLVLAMLPFSMTSGASLPEVATAASVEHSEHVSDALGDLLKHGPRLLDSNLLAQAVGARATALRLAYLRASWVEHCDARARPDSSDETRAMDRESPSTDAVRDWPHYAKARQLSDDLLARLSGLHEALVAASGADLTVPTAHTRVSKPAA